jgi:hypothetical protein
MKMRTIYLLISVFLLSAVSYGQTCVTLTASTEVNEPVPSGVGTWTPLTNTSVSDDNRAQASLNSQGFTERLKLTNFGFNLPANITIQGISVSVERSVSNSVVFRDQDIMLVKGNVTQTGTNKATLATWPTVDASVSYGNSTDLWANTWTGADINSTGFGVALSVFRTVSAGAPSTARIDFVSITVCYLPNPLPLKIKSFTATKGTNKNAIIEWVTANEQNVKELQVEKSSNGVDFILFKSVMPTGNNTTTDNRYSIQDNLVLNGINYYRIKIIDNDGSSIYSETKRVTFTDIGNSIVINYFDNAFKIAIVNNPGKYDLVVFDYAGRKLFSQSIITRLNNELISIPVKFLSNQAVIVSVKGGRLQAQKKFFVRE